MVRRDVDGSPAGDPGEKPWSRCDDPAGASPVSVSGNAPSSTATTRSERNVDEAGRRKPVNQGNLRSGERVRGPQHDPRRETRIAPEAARFLARDPVTLCSQRVLDRRLQVRSHLSRT